MMGLGNEFEDEPTITYSNVEYYKNKPLCTDMDSIVAHCQQLEGSDLIIDDNTIYEIDCNCYKNLGKKRFR